MSKESQIRNYLARNLNLLGSENELELIQEEFRLNNTLGAGGKIDILAKDIFGHYVVIEIKKSNSTAREAAHEIIKYIELLQLDLGVAPNKIRCILVSSEWHELKLTYSALKKYLNKFIHIDGLLLTLDSSGMPISTEPITEMPDYEPVPLYPEFKLCLYETQEIRTIAKPYIESQLVNYGVSDFIIVYCNYCGNNQRITFKFAILIVLHEISQIEDINLEVESEELYQQQKEETFEDEDQEILEEEILAKVSPMTASMFKGQNLVGTYDVEACNPDKFHGMLQSGWTIKSVSRFGLAQKTEILKSNNDLVKELLGLEGYNSSKFSKMFSSKFRPLWEDSIQRLNCFLRFNDIWREGCIKILEEYSNRYKELIVSAQIYDRGNWLESLLWTAWTDQNYLPKLEVIIKIPEEKSLIILTGFLEWDRETRPHIKDILDNDLFSAFEVADFFRGPESWLNTIILERHGIKYSLLESFFYPGGTSFSSISVEETEDDVYSTQKYPYDGGSINSLFDFTIANESYIHELKHIFLSSNLALFNYAINRKHFKEYPSHLPA